MPDRRGFLATLGMAGVIPGLLGATPSGTVVQPVRRALVLSGGGARGAYQAGIIAYLAASAGIRDGTPLAPYGLVCGTSIGALNGWFVATGQYTRLHDLWYGVSAARLIRLKPQFAAIRSPESGVLNRFASAVRLRSLVRNQVALLDSTPVFEWITRQVDPHLPLVMPLVWVATNLTEQRAEYFYARPPNAPAGLREEIVSALQLAIGPNTVVREASVDLFHLQLFASACVPLAWDPVEMPGPDGSINEYCDGGVASNSAVSVAHAVASAADVVLMDPPFEPMTYYTDAISIGFGTFGTMQRKILANDMRSVYFQSVAKRALARLSDSALATVTDGEPLLASFVASFPQTELSYMRPKETLPLGTAAFGDEEGIGKAYRIGWEDAQRGFSPYDWKTFDV